MQVRLFDSLNYIKAFGVGDVWVAVGWSSDILPIAKRSSNVAVVVPKSGTSLWADLWVRCRPCTYHLSVISFRKTVLNHALCNRDILNSKSTASLSTLSMIDFLGYPCCQHAPNKSNRRTYPRPVSTCPSVVRILLAGCESSPL